MGFIELLLIAVGLSMDAFAVSICKGLAMKNRINIRHMLIIAAFFGGFQALMPLLGWLLGSSLEKYITDFDHWIAFGLLSFIGGKMLIEAIRDNGSCDAAGGRLNIKELFILAIATSIDALAVGITFALLPDINILFSIALIGVVTFIFSIGGVFFGNRFGARFQRQAGITGGVILILIGVKILLEHLGVINF